MLLCDWPKEEAARYLAVVQRVARGEVEAQYVKLKDPTDYLVIFRAADATYGFLPQSWLTLPLV